MLSFSKLAITWLNHANFRVSFHNTIHLIRFEFNDVIWSRMEVFIPGKCLVLRTLKFVGGEHRHWVVGPASPT